MENNREKRGAGVLLLPFLVLFLVLSMLFSLGVGSVSIPIDETVAVLWGHMMGIDSGLPVAEAIVWGLRLPRVLLAALGGAILALAGILMQTLTQNPLAEPYILGLSSGASAGAVWVIIFGSSLSAGGYAVQIGAFLGAILSLGAVITLAGTRPTALRLVLLGLGVSAFFSALTTFSLCEAQNDAELRSAMFWMLGSFSTAQLRDLPLLLIVLVLGATAALLSSRELDGLLLGDDAAMSLGISLRPLKSAIALGTALGVALLVAKTGVVGFVGLLVPHLARKIVGPGHRRLIALSLPLGAILLVLGDTLARTVYAPEELPVGILTSLLGAPLFVWIVKKDYTFGGQL